MQTGLMTTVHVSLQYHSQYQGKIVEYFKFVQALMNTNRNSFWINGHLLDNSSHSPFQRQYEI